MDRRKDYYQLLGVPRDASVTAIKRAFRRRSAVEPVIGHVKAEHRMDRNYLKGRDGDRANAVLAAAQLERYPLKSESLISDE